MTDSGIERSPAGPAVRWVITVAVMVGAGCVSDTSVLSRPLEPRAGEVRERRVATSDSIAETLDEIGPGGKAFHAHVTTLSNPFLEGRAPGTRGIDIAAEYIAHYFERAGLEPAFAPEPDATLPGWAAGYRQSFDVHGRTEIGGAAFSFAWGARTTRFEIDTASNFAISPTSADTSTDSTVKLALPA